MKLKDIVVLVGMGMTIGVVNTVAEKFLGIEAWATSIIMFIGYSMNIFLRCIYDGGD